MYACLKSQPRIQQGDFAIESIREDDFPYIRIWRNAQIRYLRQKAPLSEADQNAYFKNVIAPEFSKEQPSQVLVRYLYKEKLIGYGGLVHINWLDRRAELSFLLDDQLATDPDFHKLAFTSYIPLLQKLSFQTLHLLRLTTETFDVRPMHIAGLEAAGFKEEGRLRKHVQLDSGEYVDSLIHGCLNTDLPCANSAASSTGNLLVTSASAKISLLKHLRKALDDSGLQSAKLLAADLNPTVPARFFADELLTPPPVDSNSSDLQPWLSFLKEHTIRWLVPTRDAELPFFSKHKAALAAEGIHVMVSDLPGLEICLDKYKFYQDLQAHNFPAIQTFETLPENATSQPWVLKERQSSGSRDAYLNLSASQAQQLSEELIAPVFQPYIEGQEFSADFYVTKSGEILGPVLRKRERIVAGESHQTTTFCDSAIESTLRDCIASLNLYGHGVAQGIIEPSGNWKILEINARFGGASALGLAAGLPTFETFLAETLGQPIASPSWRHLEAPLQLNRYPEDLLQAGAISAKTSTFSIS